MRLFFHRKSDEADFLYLKEVGKEEAKKEAAAAAASAANSKKVM
jgi:hypothetical protein